MGVSTCIITWNEEEMLPGLLYWLNHTQGIDEVCILDSYSTDGTIDILTAWQPRKDLLFKLAFSEFQGFGPQRQKCLEMASQEWILFFDADEVFCNIEGLLKELPSMKGINSVQFQGIYPYPDRKYAICIPNGRFLGAMSPVPKMIRNGFAHFTTDRKCHEQLIDKTGRLLYGKPEKDILVAPPNILIKHMAYLKSKQAMVNKGQRWLETGMIEESRKHGVPVYPSWWSEGEERFKQAGYFVKEMPREYYDVTTELF